MSVIAAKVYNDKVVMAADSIIVTGWSKRNNNFSKIVEINNMIMGSTGYCQECSIMWHYMQTHKPASSLEKDILAFMVEFAKWKNNITNNNNVENSYLMIYQGHLFEINGLFVHEISDYVAVGAGEDFATAALHLGHTPREAVKVACDLSCLVSEPIIEYSMLKDK